MLEGFWKNGMMVIQLLPWKRYVLELGFFFMRLSPHCFDPLKDLRIELQNKTN
jgi:hypothetical protein